jgi:hypothetical protein
VPIIVVNPVTTPLSTLFPSSEQAVGCLFPHPLPLHALLLIVSPLPTTSQSLVREELAQKFGIPSKNILLVDPFRASAATNVLRGSLPNSALNVQRYHDDAIGSGLSDLRTTLTALLTPVENSNALMYSRARKANSLLRSAISMMLSELQRAEHELHIADQTVRELRVAISEVQMEAGRTILGTESAMINTGREAPLSGHIVRDSEEEDKVIKALSDADKMVRPVVEGLWPYLLPTVSVDNGRSKRAASRYVNVVGAWRRWLRNLSPRMSITAMGSADDVAWAVSQAVQGAWVGGVERTVSLLLRSS